MWASKNGHKAIVRWLVEEGHAEVNREDKVSSKLLGQTWFDNYLRCGCASCLFPVSVFSFIRVVCSSVFLLFCSCLCYG